MKAVTQSEWGGTDKLELVEIERPQPLPTEVLVRVKAAGINPVDVFTREGKAYMPHCIYLISRDGMSPGSSRRLVMA
jgi:NADPH:quinone reductase-like Zn-dependent oxidoreductase